MGIEEGKKPVNPRYKVILEALFASALRLAPPRSFRG
jgi:hypothetical protein